MGENRGKGAERALVTGERGSYEKERSSTREGT